MWTLFAILVLPFVVGSIARLLLWYEDKHAG